jgi:RND family efflux transporter MFP subunit
METRPDSPLGTEENRGGGKIYRWGGGLVAGLALVLVVFIIVRQQGIAKEAKDRAAEVAAGPRVRTAPVTATSKERRVVVTAESRPFASITLYAKLTGYLGDIKVDKGDEVKKGQLLAIVSSPETTKQYQGAVADAWNKRGIAKRMKALREQNLVSQQETDQAISDARVADSRLATLAVERGYQVLNAPFDGMITARFLDPGALVTANTSAVVTLSQVYYLRVYGYVDQRDAAFVKAGAAAEVSLPERPDVKFQATVARVSGELDPHTRMMLVEVDLDNSKGLIVAGSFVQIALSIPAQSYLQIPVEAVVQRGDKLFVPVVNQNVVTYREISVADNDGQTVKVLSGLHEGEQVALNLGASLADGAHVQPISGEAR